MGWRDQVEILASFTLKPLKDFYQSINLYIGTLATPAHVVSLTEFAANCAERKENRSRASFSYQTVFLTEMRHVIIYSKLSWCATFPKFAGRAIDPTIPGAKPTILVFTHVQAAIWFQVTIYHRCSCQNSASRYHQSKIYQGLIVLTIEIVK